MFLSFNNGKKIDLSMLKEGIEIKDDNFFKSYDKNKNSIFDAEEIAQIQEDLTNAAGNDAVLSEKEALSFYAKIMNKTVEQVQNLFKKEDNTNAYSAIEQLFVDQAENETKAKMQADVDNAIEIYNQAQGGVISKGCNNLKELFNTQYAGDKVYRQIMNKQVSTWLLEEADSSDELTKKEYIERKVQLLLKFIDAEKMTGKEIASIEAGLLKSTEEELQEFLDRLVNAENDEYSQVVKQTITELNKKAYTFNELDNAFKGVNPKSLEAILNGKEGEKKLDFKTAFQFENGIEFDEEKILNAKNKAQIASINLSVSLKINSLREGLKNSALGLSSAISQPSAQESYKEQKYDQLSETILKTLREWLGNDEQKIADAIKTYSNGNAEVKDGKIVFEKNLTGKAGNSAEMLLALANDISNALFETLDKFLGEKSIEEYLADAEESDRNAYGVKNPIHVAEKFQESQFKMLSGVKFAVMGAAGLVGAMSSGLLVPILSSIVGSGLSLGVSALDSATDEKGYTAEDREAIKQELKMNAIYLPTGMAIGGASSALVGNLTKCTGFLRWLAEAGPDTAMSLLADLAITGEIDLKGEGIAQLMNIAMYVVAGAKVHRATVDTYNTNVKQDNLNTKFVDAQNKTQSGVGQKTIDIDINVQVDYKKASKTLNRTLKKLKNGNLSKDEINALKEKVISNSKSSVEYSNLVEKIYSTGGNLETLNSLVKFAESKGITDVTSLDQLYTTLCENFENYTDLFQKDMYQQEHTTQLDNLLSKIGDNSIEDFGNFIKIYTQEYGKTSAFMMTYVINNYRSIPLNKFAEAISKYSKLPEFEGLNDIRNTNVIGVIAASNDMENAVAKLIKIKEKVGLDKKMKPYEIDERVCLLDLTDIEFNNIETRNLWGCLDNFAREKNIVALAKLDEVTFIKIKERNLPLDSDSVPLAKMTDAEWDLYQKYELHGIKAPTNCIVNIVKKGSGYIETLLKRNILQYQYIDSKSIKYIDELVAMSDKEFQVIIDRKLQEGHPNRKYPSGVQEKFTLEEIVGLAKLSENDWKKAEELLYIPERKTAPLGTGAWGDENEFSQFRVNQVLELINRPESDYNLLKESGALKELRMDSIRLFLDYNAIANKNNINDLTTSEKRRLARMMTKHNNACFNDDFQNFINKKYGKNLIPNNKEAYCSLLSKLVRESGLETNPNNQKTIDNFNQTINNIADSDGAFLKTNLKDPDFKIELEYSREQFIVDIEKVLDGIPTNEKQKIMDYFGFEISTQGGKSVISGYPISLRNRTLPNDPIYKQVDAIVKRFSEDNSIKIKNNPELSAQLNNIFEAIPELKAIIGKKQHETHSYTVDIHTLNVLQEVMRNPNFKNLSVNDQKILTISTLLHDISKQEGIIDKQHPQNSAFDAYTLCSKLGLTKKEQKQVHKIIKYHDWLEKYNNPDLSNIERKEFAQFIAYELKNQNDFELAAMLTEADLKGVSADGYFYDKYKNVYNNGVNEISKLIEEIKSTEIYLPQTDIPKASKIKADGKIVVEKNIRGHKVKVFYLKKGESLEHLGFPKGTKSDDISLLYHGLLGTEEECKKYLSLLESLGDIDNDAIISTTLVGNYSPSTYTSQGLIYKADCDDIIAGAYYNLGSGRGEDKILSKAIKDYVFSNNYRKKDRSFMSDKIKEKLNLSNSEYRKLYDEIKGKSITDLEVTHPEIAKAMREIILEIDSLRINDTSQMTSFTQKYISEFLVKQGKIDAVACTEGKAVESISDYLLKCAEENDLLVIAI